MKVLVLNQSNIVNSANNQLVYHFPNSVKFEGNYIAVSSVSMYYSWYNISALNNNNTFTYSWTSGDTRTTYNITIPDGVYEVKTLNDFLQYQMIQNGTYLINGIGQNVYYAEFILNAPRYAVQLNTFLVPTTLPAKYVEPANFAGFPTTECNPIITTPAKFCYIIGFAPNFISDPNVGNSFVPPTNNPLVNKLSDGTISYLSTSPPEVQPNSSILFSMSNIDNKYAQPTSIIYSIVPTVAVGEIITERPPQFMWNKLIDGMYNEIRLTLLGTNLQPITILDPNMTILLTIRDKDDAGLSFGKG